MADRGAKLRLKGMFSRSRYETEVAVPDTEPSYDRDSRTPLVPRYEASAVHGGGGGRTENWAPDVIDKSPKFAIKRKPIIKSKPDRLRHGFGNMSSSNRSETSVTDPSRGYETRATDKPGWSESISSRISANVETSEPPSSESESKPIFGFSGQKAGSAGQFMGFQIARNKAFKQIQDAPMHGSIKISGAILVFATILWALGGFSSREAGGLTPSSPIIAVMGETGAGKSSFIRALGGRDVNGNLPTVGHTLNSTTSSVTWYSSVAGNQGFYILDTPGFDDSYMNDFAILEALTDELATIYRAERPVTGIIYVHDISKEKMGGTSQKSLRTLQKLVGHTSLESVVLVTTHWRSMFFRASQDQREEELRKTFWASMISRGSGITRHDGSKRSAKRIVAEIIRKKPVVMKIVDEMVNKNIRFADTEAGSSVAEGMKTLQGKFDSNLAAINEEISDLKKRRDEVVSRTNAQRKMLKSESAKARNAQKADIEKKLEKLNSESEVEVEALDQQIERSQLEKEVLNNAIRELQGAGKRLHKKKGYKRGKISDFMTGKMGGHGMGFTAMAISFLSTFCYVFWLFHGIGFLFFFAGTDYLPFLCAIIPLLLVLGHWLEWGAVNVLVNIAFSWFTGGLVFGRVPIRRADGIIFY